MEQSSTIESIEAMLLAFQKDVKATSNIKELETYRLKYFKKTGGILTEKMQILSTGNLSSDKKKQYGKEINMAKQEMLATLTKQELLLQQASNDDNKKSSFQMNTSLPGRNRQLGTLHPLTLIKHETLAIFNSMGFLTVVGPEIENEFYNFEALNMPKNHAARDDQDSFYLSQQNLLLRTQTSPVQIRVMEKNKPPLAIVSPGKVYRRDTIDTTHSPIFHQIEGLLVDKKVSFAQLKGTLNAFCRKMFGANIETRFRPDYFPFTEPSCEICVRFKDKWLEILGAGMVNPLVLKNSGIDEKSYSGFAFGLGIERIAMIKYDIKDIRLFYENDLKFLNQFG